MFEETVIKGLNKAERIAKVTKKLIFWVNRRERSKSSFLSEVQEVAKSCTNGRKSEWTSIYFWKLKMSSGTQDSFSVIGSSV